MSEVTREVKPSREILTDVKIKGKETEIPEIPGAFKKSFWLESPRELEVGSVLWIQTRKPWPAHVTVGNCTAKGDGKFVYSFEFVPRDTTKRAAGEVKVTNSERIDAVNSELAEIKTQNAALLSELAESRKLMQAMFEKFAAK